MMKPGQFFRIIIRKWCMPFNVISVHKIDVSKFENYGIAVSSLTPSGCSDV